MKNSKHTRVLLVARTASDGRLPRGSLVTILPPSLIIYLPRPPEIHAQRYSQWTYNQRTRYTLRP